MAQDLKNHKLLHHLDDPLRLLLWTIDEALVLLIPMLVIGLGFGKPILALVFSAGGYWVLRTMKKRFGKKILQPMLYWYLPPSRSVKRLPKSYIREYVG